MYYITYIKQPNEPTPTQMSFDDFYRAFYEGRAILATPPAITPDIQKFRTIEAETISDAYKTRFGHLPHIFERNYSAILELNKEHNMQTQYTTFKIPKQSGGMRTINAPVETLKITMQDMLSQLQHFAIYEHNAAYAYVQNRCTRDAIALHQKSNHPWFMKIDLHDFFGSCNREFIETQLKKIPFFALLNQTVLRQFIHFISLGDGLPQGSPLSPWVTNQVMVELDYHINQEAHAHGLTYTRYADDMLFSANSKNAVKHALPLVQTYLEGTPLQINTEKTKIGSIYGQNWNLGIMLNKDHNITIGYKKKERLRATIHNFIMNQTNWHYQECTELLGNIQYFHKIEPDYIDNLLTKYGEKYNMDIRATIISKIKQGAGA